MNHSWRPLLLAVLLATLPPPAPLAAADLHLDTHSFLFARYATESASCLYAAWGFGKAGVVFGMLDNHRTGYRERLGGLLIHAVRGRQSVTLAVTASGASDSAYLETYLIPTANIGPVSVSASLAWSEPLQAAGTRQLDLNPVTVLAPLRWRLAAGALYALSVSTGAVPHHHAGVVVQRTLPPGAVKVEWVRDLARSSSEVRVAVEASF